MKNKNILIAVTGSIAAYKACEVVRLLRKEGANVQVMMSKSAMEFVGKTTFAALTNNNVITEIFSNTPKAGLEHIEMAIKLDAMWWYQQPQTPSVKQPMELQMMW